ncbi:hypothetical protein M758_UG074500 [Ceratodon purpureus]|nr:hypothetical protein M758_UG074500 [Ceratodon purpureus]
MASVAVSDFGRRGLIMCREFEGLQLRSSVSRITCRSVSYPFRCQCGFTALQSSTHQEKLQAALDVVQRACQLCTSVRSSMKGREGQLDKKDNTPVTVADFGVQALVSLELGRLFPGIPLVGEENASVLRGEYEEKLAAGGREKALVEAIVDVLSPVVSLDVGVLDCETVLDAIDRGAKTVSTGNPNQPSQSAYWVLDPIDGTRGFLRGGNALYVVGLALVVNGRPVLGVMGCPNVAIQYSADRSTIQMASLYYGLEDSMANATYQRGLIMAASLGGGCWVKSLNEDLPSGGVMVKSRVDKPESVSDSWFCISDNEVWSTSPLAHALASSSVGKNSKIDEMQLLPLCCGSLCKYFAIALGGASAFLLQAGRTTPLKVWDHASGVVCVSEAGGQVSDLEGTALEDLVGNGKDDFTVEGGGIFASNKALHDLLLTDIRNQTAAVGQ